MMNIWRLMLEGTLRGRRCVVSVGRQESAQIEAPANHCLDERKPAGYLQRSKSGTLVTVKHLTAQAGSGVTQCCSATAQAPDSSLTLHSYVTHAQKQKWTLVRSLSCIVYTASLTNCSSTNLQKMSAMQIVQGTTMSAPRTTPDS